MVELLISLGFTPLPRVLRVSGHSFCGVASGDSIFSVTSPCHMLGVKASKDHPLDTEADVFLKSSFSAIFLNSVL